MRVNRLFRKAGSFLTKNTGTVLAVGGMVGVAVTCYFVAKETPEAKEALEELDEDAGIVKKTVTGAKSYKKSIAAAVVTEGLILGSSFAYKKEIALLTAFGMSQMDRIKEIDKATKKVLGDDVGEINKAVVEEKLHQPEILESAIYTGHGNILCYEPLTGHFFYGSQNYILSEALKIDKDSARYGYSDVHLNDWLDALGLPTCILGESIGWEYNPNGDTIDITFDSGVVEGLPYLAIRYEAEPFDLTNREW